MFTTRQSGDYNTSYTKRGLMKMRTLDLSAARSLFSGYCELRAGENTNESIRLLNGDVVANARSTGGGVCARVCRGGGWGFASSPEQSNDSVKAVLKAAGENADFMASKFRGTVLSLPGNPGAGKESFRPGGERLTQKDKLDFARSLDSYIAEKYRNLMSRMVVLSGFHQERALITSDGADYYSYIPRAHVFVMMTADKDGTPIDLVSRAFGGLGEFEDFLPRIDEIHEIVDRHYETLMKKRDGVFAEAGVKECILAPDLAGILAHEAVGHTVECDLVQSGSVAADLLNKPVASELVNMVDFAHHAFGEICPVPIFVDDEGTKAEDAVLIKDGVLKGYMHNRQTAEAYGVAPQGSARAFGFDDEPLIRMRNTCILPGESKLEDMIASVEDGYYLSNPTNGQADLTSEFMFGVAMGYEIKKGKLGRAIFNTTVSGVAFDMLKTVTAVSDDLLWLSSGFCGKKQPASVGMGGPAVKCKINLGGK